MRFQITITPKPGHDIERAVITVRAADWPAAAHACEKLVDQLGYHMGQVYTEITYAQEVRREAA